VPPEVRPVAAPAFDARSARSEALSRPRGGHPKRLAQRPIEARAGFPVLHGCNGLARCAREAPSPILSIAPWNSVQPEAPMTAMPKHRSPAAPGAPADQEGSTMKLTMIGLGRMGGNMARRLMRGGHRVVAFDLDAGNVRALGKDGAESAFTLAEAVSKLPAPRVCWVMVPAGEPTERVVDELARLLEAGDVIVDGGNSYFKDDVRRAEKLASKGIHYVDVGTSGGVWGNERGYCLMVGGSKQAFELVAPILCTLAPGRGETLPSPGREKRVGTAEEGFLHCGPVGAGHFVKMIHNGIEYGLMQAYAEGLDILKGAANESLPANQRYDIDLGDVCELWRRGSVVGSWLLDLTAMALAESPKLEQYSGVVHDSGEGRWTVMAAVEEAVPADVLTAALYTRFRSRQDHTFAEKVLSAMRHKFGGHVEPAKPA